MTVDTVGAELAKLSKGDPTTQANLLSDVKGGRQGLLTKLTHLKPVLSTVVICQYLSAK